MKETKRMLYTLLSLIFLFLSTGYGHLQASMLMGNIQYPSSIRPSKTSSLPVVYNCGKRISTIVHDSGIPKITFEITKRKDQNRFYLLISRDIEWVMKEPLENEKTSNTVDYLKISPDKSYKFFVLDLIQDTPQDMSLDAFGKWNGNQPLTYHWEIIEQTLPEEGKIPDSTIVVCYFPEAVKGVKGGSGIELPTIVLDSSMLDLFGSLENLKEESIKLQLTSLNSDTIHSPTQQKIKSEQGRLLIVQTLT